MLLAYRPSPPPDRSVGFALRLSLVLVLALLPLAPRCPARVLPAVEGIADRGITANRVSFRIPEAAGFVLEATLDGVSVPVGASVEVTDPDYHELRLRRTPAAGGAPETQSVRFIVRASERGNSEVGLPPWTPPPILPEPRRNWPAADCAWSSRTVTRPASTSPWSRGSTARTDTPSGPTPG